MEDARARLTPQQAADIRERLAYGLPVSLPDIRALFAAYHALEGGLDRLRTALVLLYELNESGNVGGAVYEEAMDLAMDALRDTEGMAGRAAREE